MDKDESADDKIYDTPWRDLFSTTFAQSPAFGRIETHVEDNLRTRDRFAATWRDIVKMKRKRNILSIQNIQNTHETVLNNLAEFYQQSKTGSA